MLRVWCMVLFVVSFNMFVYSGEVEYEDIKYCPVVNLCYTPLLYNVKYRCVVDYVCPEGYKCCRSDCYIHHVCVVPVNKNGEEIPPPTRTTTDVIIDITTTKSTEINDTEQYPIVTDYTSPTRTSTTFTSTSTAIITSTLADGQISTKLQSETTQYYKEGSGDGFDDTEFDEKDKITTHFIDDDEDNSVDGSGEDGINTVTATASNVTKSTTDAVTEGSGYGIDDEDGFEGSGTENEGTIFTDNDNDIKFTQTGQFKNDIFTETTYTAFSEENETTENTNYTESTPQSSSDNDVLTTFNENDASIDVDSDTNTRKYTESTQTSQSEYPRTTEFSDEDEITRSTSYTESTPVSPTEYVVLTTFNLSESTTDNDTNADTITHTFTVITQNSESKNDTFVETTYTTLSDADEAKRSTNNTGSTPLYTTYEEILTTINESMDSGDIISTRINTYTFTEYTQTTESAEMFTTTYSTFSVEDKINGSTSYIQSTPHSSTWLDINTDTNTTTHLFTPGDGAESIKGNGSTEEVNKPESSTFSTISNDIYFTDLNRTLATINTSAFATTEKGEMGTHSVTTEIEEYEEEYDYSDSEEDYDEGEVTSISTLRVYNEPSKTNNSEASIPNEEDDEDDDDDEVDYDIRTNFQGKSARG